MFLENFQMIFGKNLKQLVIIILIVITSQKNALSPEQKETVDKKSEFLDSLNSKDYTTKKSISDLMNELECFREIAKKR